MRPSRDPTKRVDEWPFSGLSAADRKKIKAILFKSHAAFQRTEFNADDPYSFIEPMQQAFGEIANVLFVANVLTVNLLNNQLRLFVIESAIAGNWLYFAERDTTQAEIFPGISGNVAVWKMFNEGLHRVFGAEIAEWTGKLLEREAGNMSVALNIATPFAPELPARLKATVHSPGAARKLDRYLREHGIGLTEFSIQAQTTDRTLRSFRKTGTVRRDILENIAKAMGTTKEALLRE